MPGDPFKKPYKGGNTKAAPGRPPKPSTKKTFVPKPASPIGTKSKKVKSPKSPSVKVTSKARRNVTPPKVRQGVQTGTPGRTGSRPGQRSW